MKFALWGVLCIIQFVVFAEARSSKSRDDGKSRLRIIGGESADIQRYPYQISMRLLDRDGKLAHFCGGSIVSERHIVTAAHCVEDKLNKKEYMRIFTGNSRSDTGGQSHSVSSIVMHPGYSGDPNYFNDIAVVTLSKPIVFSSKQRPINLPTRDVENGAAATLTGWGRTSKSDYANSIYLQQARVTLLNAHNCQTLIPWIPLTNTQVCATQSAGTGACSGDSGGPLVSNGHLIGVASHIIDECASSFPDIYTNVYYFLDFIKNIIKSEKSPQNNGQRQGNEQELKQNDWLCQDDASDGAWQKFLQSLKQDGILEKFCN